MSMSGTFVYYTPEEIADPRAGTVSVLRNYWWPTTPDGRVAIYVMHHSEFPQCNMNKNIATRIRADVELTGEPVQIPLAFVNLNISDYC